ncbi:hypothetical protein LNQ03_33290 [Klebsiella pneumoniae subsp. pneumoniae]|nr:hypothetical protein [Klebsiella pneumoniae subsp. pneumoniae]
MKRDPSRRGSPRSQQTWRGELPKSEQGYVFVLEESESGAVVGICCDRGGGGAQRSLV